MDIPPASPAKVRDTGPSPADPPNDSPAATAERPSGNAQALRQSPPQKSDANTGVGTGLKGSTQPKRPAAEGSAEGHAGRGSGAEEGAGRSTVTTTKDGSAAETAEQPPLRARRGSSHIGDRVFVGLSRGSGIALLVIMAAIAVFLTQRAVYAISKNEGNFLTTFEWNAGATPPVFGIAVLAFGTVVSAIIAMVLAVPVAVGIALFISHYAPRRLAQTLSYVIDLLAAVPSIIYGLWGALFLVPHLVGLNTWLDTYFSWTVLFDQTQVGVTPRNLFTVGILLAIMILPVITNVSREVFLQVPRTHEEAALALGATRWEMIRTAVLPFGRSGIISASMLGLGRALGETMAVATVLSPSAILSLRILDPGGGTFAQNIANVFPEATSFGRDALIASGLVLFVITLLVNGAARLIIAKHKEYSGAAA